MDKVALLTASRIDPDRSISSPPNGASYLAPALAYLLHLQRLLRSVSVFLCLQAYLLASTTLYASAIVGRHTYWATRVGTTMSGQLVYGTWDSGVVKALRRRVFDEFADFILGSGNTVILMLFWPGWWVLAGTTWAYWYLWG